jgi:hypothetical protein
MSQTASSKFVTVRTDLPISAQRAFELAHKLNIFDHVVWPLLSFEVSDEDRARAADPTSFGPGDTFSARLKFLMFIPAWIHTLTIVGDGTNADGAFELYTNESSGPVRTWNHRLTFEPTGETSCRYSDQVEVEGGIMTAPSALFVKVFFRYRQWRWRQLAAAIS